MALLIAALVLTALLAPGLDGVRDQLGDADGTWLAAAAALELLSCVSYVLMFRPIFCRQMSWRTSAEIGGAELGMGSVVPASGIGGLALGAWILHRRGMDAERIARRSVAFFIIKSSVNFIAVAVIGALLATSLVGPDLSLALTLLPAVLSIGLIALVAALRRIGRGTGTRAIAKARAAVVDGITEARAIFRSPDPLIAIGAVGYWAFDNAVLYATFEAVGEAPSLWVILLGYLIGQLGGLLPIPGGVGGIDGGLIGTLIVYGAPAETTAAAVLAYRLILFWLPLAIGALALVALNRSVSDPSRRDLQACTPIPADA